MKKTGHIMLLAAVAAMAGCERTDLVTYSPARMTLEAAFAEGGDTRTMVKDGGTSVFWEPEDEIAVFLDATGCRFSNVSEEPARTAVFEGETLLPPAGAHVFALYPYDEGAAVENGEVTARVPEIQYGRAGSISRNMNISVAHTSHPATEPLLFYNVTGGIRFTVAAAGIRRVVLDAPGSHIAGDVRLKLTDRAPYVSSWTGAEGGCVELRPGDGECFTSGEWYYISVMPATAKDGFTMTLYTDSTYALYRCGKSVTLARGQYKQIRDMDSGLQFHARDGLDIGDPKFREYCLANFDLDGSGEIEPDEADKVTEIDVATDSISSLKGIGMFVNLERLTCMPQYDSGGALTALDLTQNTSLEYLDCSGNMIGTLDISRNSRLTEVRADGNGSLKAVTLPAQSSVEILSLAGGALEQADLRGQTMLRELTLSGNGKLAEVDITENSRLAALDMEGCHIRSFSVPAWLVTLNVSANELETLDVSSAKALKELRADDNAIREVALGGAKKLELLSLSGNSLSVLDVAGNSSLKELHCEGNPDLDIVFIAKGQKFDCTKDGKTALMTREEEADAYCSKDYSMDGRLHVMQKATQGDGINVVMMGDAFSDRLIEDGTYRKVMDGMMEGLFCVEPFASMRNFFNVYSIDVVSENETYRDGRKTALATYFGEKTNVGGDNDIVISYVREVLPDIDMDNVLVIVAMNKAVEAGTCYMFTKMRIDSYGNRTYIMEDGSGLGIAYCPLGTKTVSLGEIVRHEAGGHGFGKLGDEYFYAKNYAPEGTVEKILTLHECGWYSNVDCTDDPDGVVWSRFISDPRYAAEDIGVYEGSYTYEKGFFRPSQSSIMSCNKGYFNAPSREAIYNRINRLAWGDTWEYDYEEFVRFDTPNIGRTAERMPARTDGGYRFIPLSEPVIVECGWEEAAERGRVKVDELRRRRTAGAGRQK